MTTANPPPTADLAVWWLTDAECVFIRLHLQPSLPDYITAEVCSLEGRPKRGRLWVPPGIDLASLPLADTNELLATDFINQRGGVVIHARDADLLIGLPGYITDVHAAPYFKKPSLR